MDHRSLFEIEFGDGPKPAWYIPPKPSQWLTSHVRRRANLTARRWEKFLFTRWSLVQLYSEPCYEKMDDRLIVAANDWLRVLRKLNNKELRSATHQVDLFCGAYEFSRLYTMVYHLHEVLYKYSRGVPQVRQNPGHHRTVDSGIAESDVTQARQTLARLLLMEFGTWIENISLGGWLNAYPPAAFSNFEFDRIRGVVRWTENHGNELRYDDMALDMIFGHWGPSEDDLENGHGYEPRSVFAWICGVPDDVSLSSDGVMGRRKIEFTVQAPDINSDLSILIQLSFSPDNDQSGPPQFPPGH
ncbi:uncharacterized protein GGS22DRAFT_172478 [Annulohypoxylon maeteangense]|uniref:uncharacterized protein n=1 Tax=Annulohypoxylon maeteangense TaxID=1927788 RepID=UPI002008B7DF|nr:uncharacterized protein GGS22DRAFT_172478 [Annulohypoxylon maeteangense]KAI0881568.1 hypothetical protein GGS22DRAFT_172478 [Annulohypoxylon maeteangense]